MSPPPPRKGTRHACIWWTIQPLLLGCLLLVQDTTGWTDSTCSSQYIMGTVACHPQSSPPCPCGQAYWIKATLGSVCCFPRNIGRCHNINTGPGGYPQYACNPQCSWSSWSCGTCSTACGLGTEQCIRTCGTGARDTKTQECAMGPPYSWSSWTESACSATCGPGTIRRQRQCQGCISLSDSCSANSVETNAAPCFAGTPYAWTLWSEWSPCSSQCGIGSTNRTRICQGQCSLGGNDTCTAGVEDLQTTDCTVGVAGQWTAWSTWGPCEGCGLGRRRQSRHCEGSCTGSCIVGRSEENVNLCAESKAASWSQWSTWSVFCDSVCGPGNRTRQRTCEGTCDGTCSPIGGRETDYRSCNSIFPSLADPWQAWSSCDTLTCGSGGLRTRVRQCSVGCPSDECPTSGTQLSQTGPCTAAIWSEWTTPVCPTQCGTATMESNRTCTGVCEPLNSTCTLGSVEKNITTCSVGQPAEWAEWTPTPCNNNTGIRPWLRNCTQNCHGTCAGLAVDNRGCEWNYTELWVGPLLTSSAATLTVPRARQLAVIVQTRLQALSPVDFGNVQPVFNTAQRRESSEASSATLKTALGQQANTLWLALRLEIFQKNFEQAKLIALSTTFDASSIGLGSSIGLLNSQPAEPASATPKKRDSQVGVAVGATFAAIVALGLLILLVRRLRSSRRANFLRVNVAPFTADTALMMKNPLYKPGKDGGKPGHGADYAQTASVAYESASAMGDDVQPYDKPLTAAPQWLPESHSTPDESILTAKHSVPVYDLGSSGTARNSSADRAKMTATGPAYDLSGSEESRQAPDSAITNPGPIYDMGGSEKGRHVPDSATTNPGPIYDMGDTKTIRISSGSGTRTAASPLYDLGSSEKANHGFSSENPKPAGPLYELASSDRASRSSGKNTAARIYDLASSGNAGHSSGSLKSRATAAIYDLASSESAGHWSGSKPSRVAAPVYDLASSESADHSSGSEPSRVAAPVYDLASSESAGHSSGSHKSRAAGLVYDLASPANSAAGSQPRSQATKRASSDNKHSHGAPVLARAAQSRRQLPQQIRSSENQATTADKSDAVSSQSNSKFFCGDNDSTTA